MSRTPFLVGALVCAAAGAGAYMASSRSSDAPSIIAARRDKVYNHDEPSGYNEYQATCSRSDNNMIQRSIATVKPILEQSIYNRDDQLWDKWFGVNSPGRTDADVMSIMVEALEMFDNPNGWTPLCCHEDRGPCNCGGAIAYVQSGVYGSWETGLISESTWMRLCPTMLDSSNEEEFGLVIYHELIHMVSYAGDADGGYNKLGAHRLAQISPDVARLSADNYTMYVAQNGMSYEHYTMFTQNWWGANAMSVECADRYTNCWDSAKDCCRESDFDGCCATCTRMAVTAKCSNDPNAAAPPSSPNGSDNHVSGDNMPDNGGPNDCTDNWPNCADSNITGEGCCGVKSWSDGELYAAGCCATCAARDAAGLCDDVQAGAQGDRQDSCPSFVGNRSCDGQAFDDGTPFWDWCGESCSDVKICDSQGDWWTSCPSMVDGRTCDGRLWDDGTKHWDECCVSCNAVKDAAL